MKVVIILDQFNRGGSETLSLDLCRNADKSIGLEVVLVATGGGELETDFRNSGVNFIRLQRKFPIDPFVIWKIRSIIKKKGIDIVHAHQAVEGLHAYLAARWTKAKVVISYHGYNISNKKDNKTLEFLAPRVDANIAVSRGFIQRLKKQSRLKNLNDFHVIYNGIDKERLNINNDKRNEIKQELNLKDNVFLAGMVGNFRAAKGQYTICKALPHIIQKIPNFHFAFVGGQWRKEPNYYKKCYNFCKDNNLMNNVHFLGNRSNIGSFLSLLDLFVFSTIEDTFGIAVVEAMLIGVPTLSSDIPPLLEVTNKGKYGMLFKTKDEKDLSEKVFFLVNDKYRLKELSEEGKEWALKQFLIQNYIKNLMSLYISLIQK